MRILIATGIYPPDIGGPATIIKALSVSLKKKGFGVEVITYAETSGEEKENEIRVVKVSKKGNKISRYFNYFFQLARLARKADIIYATDLYSVGYFAYLLKKFWHKKYIIRFAGDSAWETAVSSGETNDYIADFQGKKYSRRIEKFKKRRRNILLSADRVIAVSNFLADIARKIGVDENKIKIIYNSIDFYSYPADSLQTEKIREKYGKEKKIIITACRLTPWKGVNGIIKILPELESRINGVSFLVLGSGPELLRLKELAQKSGVADRIYFLGKVEHKEILNYFRAADLFILNTNYEGFSHAILEAIKAGAPVVATNIGGNPEMITDGQEGFLVGYNNEKELLEACSKILADKELAKKFAEKAKEKLKQFNWEENIQKTAEVIKKAVNNE